MSDKNETRPFGARDKWGYLFGDFGNDFTFIFRSEEHTSELQHTDISRMPSSA